MGAVTLDYEIVFGVEIVRDDISTADTILFADAATVQLILRPDVQQQLLDSVSSMVDVAIIDIENRPDLLQGFTESLSLTDLAIPDLENRPDLSQGFAESLLISDGTVSLHLGGGVFAKLFAEVMTVQDSQQRLMAGRSSFADQITLADSLRIQLVLGFADQIVVSDFVQTLFGLQVSDQIVMDDAVRTPLQITTTAIPDATNGVPYSFQLQAQGGTPPYTWSILSGTLPTGLSLDPDGTISGTPTETVSMDSVTFSVSDSG